MRMTIKRIKATPTFTEGHLYVDDVYICDTLEPADKHLDQNMKMEDIRKYKKLSMAMGIKCAIPYGTYTVTITFSPKFKKYLPLINGVKGFSAIRIHEGNTVNSTSGCILVGKRTEPGVMAFTRKAVAKVMSLLRQNGGNGKLVIKK